jgi:HAD superfamily hydrolase (TIGR01490 family)
MTRKDDRQTMPLRAAFFDLDKTLIPGSSLFLLARGLYERDMVRVRDLLRFGWGQLMFRLRGESLRGMDRSRESTLDFVAGRSQDELIRWGREIAAERILPIVYENIVRVIESHRERGELTFLVTAAPIELARTIATELKMDGAVGTVSEVDGQGFYTGRLVGDVLHGPAKAKAVAELASEKGIQLIDCAAYSDSINDLPLLESVGSPHAVNPETELRRLARERGWPVHELRTRRHAVLIGGGIALGAALSRRRARATAGPLERVGRRLHI